METACTILVAGGCEVHAESELRCQRLDDDTAAVTLKRRTPCGHYHDWDGNMIDDFTASVPAAQVAELLAALAKAVDTAPPGDGISTAMMRLTVTATGEWDDHARAVAEEENGPEMDPILEIAEEFVAKVYHANS